MFGDNPKRKPVNGDGSVLDVQEVFSTIQGEGPNAGQPAVFVRLGGCNLACTFCDTEFESFNEMKLEEILEEVKEKRDHQKLVVITGGEPMRQPLERLCQGLIDLGLRVQIETNGTLYRDLPEGVEIVCSPKNIGNGYTHIREDLLEKITALKFIVAEGDELYSGVEDVGQSKFNTPVYVQPMDEQDKEKNRKNHEHAIKIVNENNYRLSIQQHKILGLQ